jgi:toxin-antitoxin system PIN domain toxin
MLLPDVNVWLALTFDSHVHHSAAKSWFDGLSNDNTCCFCRLTQQEFLRLATNRSVFGDDARTLVDAWRLYDLFLRDPRVMFVEEPFQIESHWRTFTQKQTYSPHVWNDAYLAAFALGGGLQFVTFDRAFAQYPNLTSLILA